MTRRRPRAAAFLRTTIIPKLRGGSGEGAVAAPLPSAASLALHTAGDSVGSADDGPTVAPAAAVVLAAR